MKENINTVAYLITVQTCSKYTKQYVFAAITSFGVLLYALCQHCRTGYLNPDAMFTKIAMKINKLEW